jgi:hypothetical protein
VAEKVSIVLACTAELGQPGAICWFPTDRDGQESEIVSSLLCLEGPATCMALSHCGTILILGGECGEVAIFDVNDEVSTRPAALKFDKLWEWRPSDYPPLSKRVASSA